MEILWKRRGNCTILQNLLNRKLDEILVFCAVVVSVYFYICIFFFCYSLLCLPSDSNVFKTTYKSKIKWQIQNGIPENKITPLPYAQYVDKKLSVNIKTGGCKSFFQQNFSLWKKIIILPPFNVDAPYVPPKKGCPIDLKELVYL